jgi:hypothetical protein
MNTLLTTLPRAIVDHVAIIFALFVVSSILLSPLVVLSIRDENDRLIDDFLETAIANSKRDNE